MVNRYTMNKDTYTTMMNWIKQRQSVVSAIRIGNKILTMLVYVSFIVFVGWMIATDNQGWIRVLLITGIPFVLLSAFRKILARKRPYEVYDSEPVIKRSKTGDSFPSRHIFSAFVIATTLGSINIYIGLALGIVGLLVAILRVVGGVHFISDVLAGMVIGVLSGIIGVVVIGI